MKYEISKRTNIDVSRCFTKVVRALPIAKSSFGLCWSSLAVPNLFKPYRAGVPRAGVGGGGPGRVGGRGERGGGDSLI